MNELKQQNSGVIPSQLGVNRLGNVSVITRRTGKEIESGDKRFVDERAEPRGESKSLQKKISQPFLIEAIKPRRRACSSCGRRMFSISTFFVFDSFFLLEIICIQHLQEIHQFNLRFGGELSHLEFGYTVVSNFHFQLNIYILLPYISFC